MLSLKRTLVWLIVASIVVIADQLTKAWIASTLALGAATYVAPILDLVHVRNSGAAFSFLADRSGWQREFFVAIGIAASCWIIWMLIRAGRDQAMFCAALSLILGGALGNVTDRVQLGAVVDFLHFHWGPHYWPAFNVADTAISCGAMLLILDALLQGRRRARHKSAAGG